MMWVAWRQQRLLVIVFLCMAVLLAAWALISGLHMQTLWNQFLAAPCDGGLNVAAATSCNSAFKAILNGAQYNDMIDALGIIIGPLFGMVLGVNAVAREIDQKTIRLAWTQSESRTYWLTRKFLVSFFAIVIILVPLRFVLTWWVGASHFSTRLSTKAFPVAGSMIIVYALFCFVLAVALSLVIRRAGWAFAVGLILFAVLFYTMQTHVRFNLVTPSVASMPVILETYGSSVGFVSSGAGSAPANSLVIGNGFEPKGQRGVPSTSLMTTSTTAMIRCEDAQHQQAYCEQHLKLRSIQLYIRDGQFWTLQSLEGAIYLTLAALLSIFAFIRVRFTKV